MCTPQERRTWLLALATLAGLAAYLFGRHYVFHHGSLSLTGLVSGFSLVVVMKAALLRSAEIRRRMAIYRLSELTRTLSVGEVVLVN